MHLERDANEWARARLDPAHRSGPVCAPALWRAVDNPLDLHACVAACLARGAETCVVPMGTLGAAREVLDSRSIDPGGCKSKSLA